MYLKYIELQRPVEVVPVFLTKDCTATALVSMPERGIVKCSYHHDALHTTVYVAVKKKQL